MRPVARKAGGRVGDKALKLALASDILPEVIAPTRTVLASSAKLVNLVGDLPAQLHRGKRGEARPLGGAVIGLLRLLAPMLPRKYRVNPAEANAAALLDAVVVAKAGCRRIVSEEMNRDPAQGRLSFAMSMDRR
jgi:hypothetical protein